MTGELDACILLIVVLCLTEDDIDRFFNLVAKSESHEAFLAVILLTVLAMSALTEGLGLSNTLGAFMAGVLLSETKYRYQVGGATGSVIVLCNIGYPVVPK